MLFRFAARHSATLKECALSCRLYLYLNQRHNGLYVDNIVISGFVTS